ncbi:MAG: hemin uptake protein HemP [Burkholderiales bacterium]|nr:hemin uptake protein HemP [Burkholderiales bacterium]
MNRLSPVKTSPQPAPLAVNGVVRAQDLLGTGSVLVIEHASERYLLRLTKNGKLILTK